MPEKPPPSRGARIAAGVTLVVIAIPVLILVAGLCIRLARWAF